MLLRYLTGKRLPLLSHLYCLVYTSLLAYREREYPHEVGQHVSQHEIGMNRVP